MTRKRFVKLLMSHGYTRNEAEAEALEVQLSGPPVSYAIRYAHMQSTGVLLIRKLKYRMAPVATSAVNAARALRNFAAAFKKLFEEEM